MVCAFVLSPPHDAAEAKLQAAVVANVVSLLYQAGWRGEWTYRVLARPEEVESSRVSLFPAAAAPLAQLPDKLAAHIAPNDATLASLVHTLKLLTNDVRWDDHHQPAPASNPNPSPGPCPTTPPSGPPDVGLGGGGGRANVVCVVLPLPVTDQAACHFLGLDKGQAVTAGNATARMAQTIGPSLGSHFQRLNISVCCVHTSLLSLDHRASQVHSAIVASLASLLPCRCVPFPLLALSPSPALPASAIVAHLLPNCAFPSVPSALPRSSLRAHEGVVGNSVAITWQGTQLASCVFVPLHGPKRGGTLPPTLAVQCLVALSGPVPATSAWLCVRQRAVVGEGLGEHTDVWHSLMAQCTHESLGLAATGASCDLDGADLRLHHVVLFPDASGLVTAVCSEEPQWPVGEVVVHQRNAPEVSLGASLTPAQFWATLEGFATPLPQRDTKGPLWWHALDACSNDKDQPAKPPPLSEEALSVISELQQAEQGAVQSHTLGSPAAPRPAPPGLKSVVDMYASVVVGAPDFKDASWESLASAVRQALQSAGPQAVEAALVDSPLDVRARWTVAIGDPSPLGECGAVLRDVVVARARQRVCAVRAAGGNLDDCTRRMKVTDHLVQTLVRVVLMSEGVALDVAQQKAKGKAKRKASKDPTVQLLQSVGFLMDHSKGTKGGASLHAFVSDVLVPSARGALDSFLRQLCGHLSIEEPSALRSSPPPAAPDAAQSSLRKSRTAVEEASKRTGGVKRSWSGSGLEDHPPARRVSRRPSPPKAAGLVPPRSMVRRIDVGMGGGTLKVLPVKKKRRAVEAPDDQAPLPEPESQPQQAVVQASRPPQPVIPVRPPAHPYARGHVLAEETPMEE